MKKSTKIGFAVVIALLILVVAILAYRATQHDTKTVSTETTTTSSTTQETKTTTAQTAATNCGLTKTVTEGPYYVSGTNELTDGNLNYDSLAGTAITLTGHVYSGADGTNPVKNAKIEVWQADDSGSYHPNANGAANNYSADQLSLRGYVTTTDAGAYTINTIYPGFYEGRARHIHFKISADGFQSVTTQLIFQPKSGDHQTYSTDSIAQSLGECYLMNLSDATPQTGAFDFHLSAN